MKYELIKKEQPTKCVGYSIFLNMPEEHEKIPALWEKLNRNRHKISHLQGTSYGISEFVGDKVKYSAMAEVSEFADVPDDMLPMTLAPCSYAQYTHSGTIQEIGKTCEQIYSHLPDSGLKPGGPLIEVYSKDFKGVGSENVPILLTLETEAALETLAP